DNHASWSSATVTIDVRPDPVAAADTFTVLAGTTLTQSAPGVLANDTVAEGDSLTASVVTDPAHGTITLNANGSFSYTPNANFAGWDTFTYQIFDGRIYSAAAPVFI